MTMSMESFTLPHVHTRAPCGIGLELSEDLARHRRGVAFAEREELQQIGDRVAFGPSEVDMRDLTGLISDVDQQRRDRVWNRRTPREQHAVAADLDASQLQHIAELRRVP